MLALSNYQWTILLVMAVCYLFLCVRTALRMKDTGRSFLLWLVVTVCLTSIPATIVLMIDQYRGRFGPWREEDDETDEPDDDAAERRPPKGTRRCPHCGSRFRTEDVDTVGGVPTCPSCGLTLDQAGPA